MSAMCVRILVAVAAGAAVSAASADLVNGDFENMPNFGAGVSGDAGYSALTGSQIPGWTIEAGHAATVHNTALYPTISGSYSINVDGEGYNGVNASLYQDFSTVGGIWYTLAFDWLRWTPGGQTMLRVTITDLSTNTQVVGGSYLAGDGVQHATLPWFSTGNMMRVRIQEMPASGVNDNAFIVDNFVLTPTPGAAALLGLGALAGGRRRR